MAKKLNLSNPLFNSDADEALDVVEKSMEKTTDNQQGSTEEKTIKIRYVDQNGNPVDKDGNPVTVKMGRPRKKDLVRGISAQEGMPPELTRFSVILKVSALNDLKDYAYTKRMPIKDAITEIIEKFMDEYRADPNNEPLVSHKKK